MSNPDPNPARGYLTITPGGNVNIGQGPTGTPITQDFTLTAQLQSVLVNSVGITGAGFSLVGVPATPFTVSVPSPVTFTVSVVEGAPGDYTGTLTVGWENGSFDSNLVVHLTVNFTNGTITCVPAQINFPKANAGTPAQVTVTLHNNTGGPCTITALTFDDSNFTSDAVNPALPFTINDGNTQALVIDFNHNELGVINRHLTVVNSIANLTVPITASTVYITPVDVLTGATTALWLAIDGPTNTHFVKQAGSDPGTFNSDQISTLVFNGSLWDVPGVEKTLERLEMFYENLGQCTFLLTCTVWRQSLNSGAGGYDNKTASLAFGDVSADGSERSAFFDIQASGELILISITRAANAGPFSILGFSPHWQDRGEKVENI